MDQHWPLPELRFSVESEPANSLSSPLLAWKPLKGEESVRDRFPKTDKAHPVAWLAVGGEEFGLAKITAHAFVTNPASAWVSPKCRFKQESYVKMH